MVKITLRMEHTPPRERSQRTTHTHTHGTINLLFILMPRASDQQTHPVWIANGQALMSEDEYKGEYTNTHTRSSGPNLTFVQLSPPNWTRCARDKKLSPPTGPAVQGHSGDEEAQHTQLDPLCKDARGVARQEAQHT